MNIHHLELFYYVAKHRGIAEAVRRIPWGIQQPAVSSQIGQLERDLGVTLFRRRPFTLTPQGEELFRFVAPFFSNVDAMAEKIRGTAGELIRIAASATVLREHLPEVLRKIRARFPKLRFTLHEANPEEMERLLRQQEVDLVISVFDSDATPSGLEAVKLLSFPPALLVQNDDPAQSAADIWSQDPIGLTLVCLPAYEPLSRCFQKGLAGLGVAWAPGIEVNSLDLVETYVANGFGIGLTVAEARRDHTKSTRLLRLEHFPPIELVAMWKGEPSATLQAVIELIVAQAKVLSVGW